MLKYRRIWLALGWVWIAAIVYFSLVPLPPLLQVRIKYSDLIEHALAYFTLMLWFCQVYQKPAHRVALAAVLICLGVSMEFLQRMTGYRYFEYSDMAANSAGVLLGWAVACSGMGRIGSKLEAKLSQSS